MREWNADAYHRVSAPQFDWGLRVLDRLPLSGDEVVLDVGCGTGRLTEKLVARVPRGYVVALDFSANMLARAREHLGAGPDGRVAVVRADAAWLPMAARADAVFSTATFHWVPDHPQLFRSLYQALVPGGRLVAQCGGGPNVARLHQRADALMRETPFSTYFVSWRDPWNYAEPEPTAARMRTAGFVDVVTSLEPAPVVLPDREAFKAFLITVICHPHLTYLPEGPLREAFIDKLAQQAADDSPAFELDYWRLNMSARRP
jgi:trans-aconitate methyltransferase